MITRRSILAFGAVAAAAGCTGRAQPDPSVDEQGFLLRNVEVFDGQRMLDADCVRVGHGMITDVGRDLAAGGLRVHDGGGTTVLPGLIDAHTHVRPGQLDSVRFGVTTMLDMFTASPSWIPEAARARAEPIRTTSADVWSSGIGVTAPGGWPAIGTDIPTLGPDDDAAAFVAERLAEGSDYIKIFVEDGRTGSRGPLPSLTVSQLRTAVAAAHDHDVLAVVHVSAVEAALAAAAAGADALAHIPDDKRFTTTEADALRAASTAVVATLSVKSSASCGPHAATLKDDPRVKPFLTDLQVRQLDSRFSTCLPQRLDNSRDNVGILHRAGVQILAGTDAANPGTAFGASMLAELPLLVEAGMSPAAALTAATAAVADVFGLGDRGRIAPGKRADLLLVNGNPTADIYAIRDIAAVWKNGHPIER